MPIYDAYRAILIPLGPSSLTEDAPSLSELLCDSSTIPPSSQILIDASGRQIVLGDKERDKDVLESGHDVYLFDRRLIEESHLLSSTEIPISELDLLDFSQEAIPSPVLASYCRLLMKSTAEHLEYCQTIWVSLSIYHGALLAAYTNYRHYIEILTDQWRAIEEGKKLKSRLKSLANLVEHFQTNWTLMHHLPFSDSLKGAGSDAHCELAFLIDLFDRERLETAYHATSQALHELDAQVHEAASLVSDIVSGFSPALTALERMKLALDDKSTQLVEADRHLSQLDLLYYNIQQDFLTGSQTNLNGALLANHSSLQSLISIENQSTNMTLEFVKGREEFSIDFQSCLKWISERQNEIRSAQSMILALESMLKSPPPPPPPPPSSSSPSRSPASSSPPTPRSSLPSGADAAIENERLLTQFHRTPSLYFAALMEIVRRKNYSQLKHQRLVLVNEALQSIQANEAKRRQRFESEIIQQFPQPSLLSFLSPSNKQDGASEEGGRDHLPNLTLDQIQQYSKILEDLAQTATLAEAETSPLPALASAGAKHGNDGAGEGEGDKTVAVAAHSEPPLNKKRIWKLLSTIKEVLNYLTFMPREFDQILSSSLFDDRVTRLEAENAALKTQLQGLTGGATTTAVAPALSFKDAPLGESKATVEGYEQKLKGYEERIRGLESALQSSYSALKEVSDTENAAKGQMVDNTEKEKMVIQRISTLLGYPVSSDAEPSDTDIRTILSVLEEEWTAQKLILAASAKKSSSKKKSFKEAEMPKEAKVSEKVEGPHVLELVKELEKLLSQESLSMTLEEKSHVNTCWQKVSDMMSTALTASLHSESPFGTTEKITVRDFKVGDVGLFLPTKNPNLWSAFHYECPHYYLDLSSLGSADRGASWNLGRILVIEEKISQKGHVDQIDKGKVFPVGFIYHLVKITIIAKG